MITGSSGLIGSALVKGFEERGVEFSRLVRRKPASSKSDILWDPARNILDSSRLKGVNTVIHLSGKNIVSGRWDSKLKEEIRFSRLNSTKVLCTTLVELTPPPKLLISASAIGFYGAKTSSECTEESPPGKGFLADICRDWEAETQPAIRLGIRVVHLRLGMVLSLRGGALSMMLPAFKLGGGGVLGDGHQHISWVTLDDVINIVNFIMDNGSILGPVNAVAPNPVTNREFTKILGRVLRRPTICTIPRFALRLALGEMADETVLANCNVIPKKLLDGGYKFIYPNLEDAFKALLSEANAPED